MSQSIVFGIAPYELIPAPDFAAGQDATGAWTGTQTYSCRKYDFSSKVIQDKIAKGTPITDLYTSLGSEWSFLVVDSFRHEHQPGGITKIFVDFVGVQTGAGGEALPTDYSVSMNATMTDISILKHPRFLGELDSPSQRGISGIVNGTAVRQAWSNESEIIISSVTNLAESIANLSTVEQLWWYDYIITKGQTTYEASSVEWTITGTTRGGISDEDMSNFSYINSPPDTAFMRPPVFTGRNWRFVGASQSRTRGDEKSAKTWSKTWLLSPPGEEWETKIYTPYTP